MAEIKVEAGENGTVIVRIPKDNVLIEKIKTIKGRRWNGKYWVIPETEDVIERLGELFGSEIQIITPELEIKGGLKEDGSPEAALLTQTEDYLRLKGYTYKTRKAYLGHVRRFIELFGDAPLKLGEPECQGISYEAAG